MDLEPSSPPGAATWALGHFRPWLVFLLLLLLGLSAWHEFRSIDFHLLRSEVRRLSVNGLAVAFALTIVNVLAMGVYDVVALSRPWSDPPPSVRWRVGSLSFVISNLMATGPLAGPALRLWLYREHGVSTDRIAACIVGGLVGLWGGLGIWLAVLSVASSTLAALLAAPILAVGVGLMLERGAARRWLPQGWTITRQRWSILLLIGVIDWAVAAAVFLAMLAAAGLLHDDFSRVAFSFFLGQAAGALSFMPGGLGSADAFWLWRLGTVANANSLAAAILAYRFVYYVIPWIAGGLVLVTEWTADRPSALKFVRSFCALAAAASGGLILLSAATPAVRARLHLVAQWLPLGILELSHFAAVLVGLGLVALSRGLRQGFRDAMTVIVFLLGLGVVASLTKGGDWEEALVLAATAAIILRHHRAFLRTGSVWRSVDEVALLRVLFVTGLFIAVGFWAYRDVPYTADLWAQIAVHAEASRFLRAAGILALAASVLGLFVSMRPERRQASAAEIDAAIARILANPQAPTMSLTIANGDKLAWTYRDRSLLVYSVIGNLIAVLCDPVVPLGEERECLDGFLTFAENEGLEVVFYQVSPRWLPPLHDQGFSMFKLGEEAILDLRQFSLSGRRSKPLRHTLHHLAKAGISIRIIEPEEVRARLAELRFVSDSWLRTKRMAEKRFSVGFFDPAYLGRFPCAVAESAGRIVAFVSLLPGPPGGEASMDLMRSVADAPDGVMDGLFVKAFQWARDRGQVRFSLGMAPLSTVGESSRASLWERMAKLMYSHGEVLYNFRGVRQYKEKFHPSWEPRYMAYKPAWNWPRVMGAVSALIAGGWSRMVLPARWIDRIGWRTAALLLLASTALASTPNSAPPPGLPPGVVTQQLTLPAVGSVPVYRPAELGRVRRVVLFLSGDGGWNLGVVDMALRLAPSAVVAGIDTRAYMRRARSDVARCWYPAGELEQAAQALEKTLGLPAYLKPTLVGYSSGATLVYGTLAQAPQTTFAGGVSLGFCPDLETPRSFCGRGSWIPSLAHEGRRTVQYLPPQRTAMAPWVAIQGNADEVCAPEDVAAFVAQVPSATLERIDNVGHGFRAVSRWGGRFDAAVAGLPSGAADAAAAKAAVNENAGWVHGIENLDLGLRAMMPEQTPRAVMIFISGDGGWADLDQSVATALTKQGVLTIGWSSLRFFWSAKSPEEVLRTIETIRGAIPKSLPVFVGGYSFGAEVSGYLAPQLQLLARGILLLGPGRFASFEVSPLDWIRSGSSKTPYPVAAGLTKTTLPWLCLESAGDREDSGCAAGVSALQKTITVGGGHHFGGDYDGLAARAGQWISEVLARDESAGTGSDAGSRHRVSAAAAPE